LLKSGTVTAEKEVNVGPGAKLPVTVELGAAKLTARGLPADGTPPDNIVFFVTELAEDGSPAGSPPSRPGFWRAWAQLAPVRRSCTRCPTKGATFRQSSGELRTSVICRVGPT
jgi:hypothetical protein